MKHFFALFFLLVAGLGFTAARAQNYRPFRFGLSYQLSARATPGDTTHLLRLASGQLQGADSVFLFEKRTSRTLTRPASCGDYVRRRDNLFGESMRGRPGAEYVFAAANGHTFTLRLRAPLGQAWAATAGGLTASVTARTLGTVLGQPDSLATVTLSDGAVLVIGKRLGWVSGPPLGRYLNGRLPQAPLTLTALPELGLGTRQLGAFVVYDFQPGDVFLRKAESTQLLGPGVRCLVQQWTRDSIISRTLNASGTLLEYQQQSRTLTRNCGGTPVLSAPVVQTVRITPATDQLDQPTSFWALTAGSIGSLLHLPAWRTANYNGRPVQQHMAYGVCNGAVSTDSTSLFDTSGLDYGFHVSTAPGLGRTRAESISFTSEITTLIGYRKGAETWGQLTTFAQLLPARASRPASTSTAFPNPFAAELAVGFTLTQAQPVGLTLRDALGRLVLEQAATPLAAGARQLTLPTAGLPAGAYTLHLRLGAEGRTEVLRVLKAQ